MVTQTPAMRIQIAECMAKLANGSDRAALIGEGYALAAIDKAIEESK